MRIRVTSIFVDDQDAARTFYTEKLGFKVKHDVPVGNDSWLTVVGADDDAQVELLLEPSDHPAVAPHPDALRADGIPLLQIQVDDVEVEHARLTADGVVFIQPPTDIGPAVHAVLDDTCGNLVQLLEAKSTDLNEGG